MTSNLRSTPPAAFQNFFSHIYGERWDFLLKALSDKEKQVARPNLFAKCSFDWDGIGEIPRAENGLLGFYIMDPASIAVAKALMVEPEQFVLDMCAAPGGKTLLLIEALGLSGQLLANEISEPRRQRLKKVIQQYVPRDVRDHVSISGKDGGLFALSHKQYFDRILVDAPCSGERHLLQNQKELSLWTENRSKKLAQRQYALLTAALLAIKPGGRIVYSTCSISPYENDAVIAELKRRKGESFEVLKLSAPEFSEETEYGFQFLPDRNGWGPIYLSILISK